MAGKACVKRLQKEYHAFCKEPVPQVVARPLPNDILEWHYVLEGSKGTPYEGGCYYGKIKFPLDYPFKPPSISMTTPNGRFAPDRKLCLSMSNFHPETWNPMWSVSSILTGLLSFMMDNAETAGSIRTSNDEKRKLARISLAYNCESKNCSNFRKLFHEYVEKYQQQQNADRSTLEQQEQNEQHPPATAGRHPTGTVGEENNDLAPPPAVRRRPTRVEGEENKALKLAADRRWTKKMPYWLVVLLASVFGFLMALPFLQP